MPVITSILPLVHRRKRLASQAPVPPPPVGAPVLVAATFDTSDGAVLTLTFDRAVEVVGFNPAAVIVTNEPGESRYDGGAGALLMSPTTVRVDMTQVDVVPPGTGVLLLATGASGIVAAEGATPWAGADDLELPWP